MKTSQYSHVASIDDFEDLTLFVNESFDTDDVDLFEFISEESSQLTKLKSIILSLDWEINDDILNELDDELINLNEIWSEDKVAEVYIQGLSKIGKYIRAKGAYAHPNSIKLLLTFFYDFEKIISSTTITGEEITKILKGDVRKFKILQYQINQSELLASHGSGIHSDPGKSAVPSGQSEVLTKQNACRQVQATILSLDWEVTDENLRQFNEKIEALRPQIADNKLALILIQGLQALGDYISDERADAHPDSFILLHSFNDALEAIMKTGDQRLEQTQVQDILIDQINRMNSLKMFIASPSKVEVNDPKLDQVFEELSSDPAEITTEAAPPPPPVAVVKPDVPKITPPSAETTPPPSTAPVTVTDHLAAELDMLFSSDALPAMESDGIQYPDEVLPADAIYPIDDEVADDFIESQLSSRHDGLMPALSDADETAGFDADTEQLDLPTQHALTEQLNSFFTDTDEETKAAFAASLNTNKDANNSPAALMDDDDLPSGDSVVAALSDAEVPADREEFDPVAHEVATGLNPLEIQNKLDSFFADIDDEQDESATALALETEDAGQDFAEDGELAAADFGVEEMDLDALQPQDDLDNFFSEDRQREPVPLPAAEAEEEDVAGEDEVYAVALEVDEMDVNALQPQSDLDNFFAEDGQDEPVPPPAAEAEEDEQDFAGAGDFDAVALEVEKEELDPPATQNNLDSFFAKNNGESVESASVSSPESEETEGARSANEPNKPQPALADNEEGYGFPDEDEIEALNFTPIDEIEEKLNLFFGIDDEEKIEDIASPTGSVEESLGLERLLGVNAPATEDDIETKQIATAPPEVDELTKALEATLDQPPAPTFKFYPRNQNLQATPDQPSAPPASATTANPAEIQLATLGALLPLVVRTPSRDNLAQAAAIIAELKQAKLSPTRQALTQLLDSTLTLLVRLPAKEQDANEKLINYLYEQLLADRDQANVLSEAVNRFTAWLGGRVMPIVPAVSSKQQPEMPANYTTKELYIELSELRTAIREEFAKLQHEMRHHK